MAERGAWTGWDVRDFNSIVSFGLSFVFFFSSSHLPFPSSPSTVPSLARLRPFGPGPLCLCPSPRVPGSVQSLLSLLPLCDGAPFPWATLAGRWAIKPQTLNKPELMLLTHSYFQRVRQRQPDPSKPLHCWTPWLSSRAPHQLKKGKASQWRGPLAHLGCFLACPRSVQCPRQEDNWYCSSGPPESTGH